MNQLTTQESRTFMLSARNHILRGLVLKDVRFDSFFDKKEREFNEKIVSLSMKVNNQTILNEEELKFVRDLINPSQTY
jgi:hypothetical protein